MSASRSNIHVLTGAPATIDLRSLRAKQHRVSRALLKAQRMLESALREYHNAQALAVEDHVPINLHMHERIVESLVSADCLMRTEIALRSQGRPNGEPDIDATNDPVEEET